MSSNRPKNTHNPNSKETLKKATEVYNAHPRPNRFRTLHREGDYRPPGNPKNPSLLQSSFGNIFINISEHPRTRSRSKINKSLTHDSLDADLDNDFQRVSIKHRRSLDCDRFTALGDSRLGKVNRNSTQKHSPPLGLNASASLLNMRQVIDKFITNFQSIMDSPISLSTKETLQIRCKNSSATLLAIVVRRKLRSYFASLH